MSETREYDPRPDGSPVGWQYLYTCKECGRRYLEDVLPEKQTFPICHNCFTGGREGPSRVFDEGLTRQSHWRDAA